jgi:hypothetical protein
MATPIPHPAPLIRLLTGSLLLPAGVVSAVPTGTNLGFENNLTGWTWSGVAIETSKVYAGSKSLALRGGFIQQAFTGLGAGERYRVTLAYRDNTPEEWILSHARVRIDGEVIGEIHNGQDDDYLDAGGFEFIAGASTATLRIESLDPGPGGLLLDSIAMVAGGLPAAPEHAWSSLTAVSDSLGGRRLANGSFEMAPEASDPHNYGPAGNPHLAGYSLPHWLVTRESVDLLENDDANAPHGTKSLDAGGDGPGGISQTITGLQAGAAYTFSFLHARHTSWGEDDMTGEVHANGRRVASLVRTIHQTWDDGYGLKEIPVLASAEGTLTVEIRSTTTDRGGNIIYDDVRLKQGGDGFLAWSLHHGVWPDPDGDTDGDGIRDALEFLLGSDPKVRDSLPGMSMEGTQRRLRVPISGLARSAGYSHVLRCSRDLLTWKAATDPDSGVTILSDNSSAGVDGERVYQFEGAEERLFWKHEAAAP